MPDEHWKLTNGEQHHKRVYRLDLNWYEGNITKYAERCRHKGVWLDDVLKILDYTLLYMESAGKELFNEINQEQNKKMQEMAQRLKVLSGVEDFERTQMKRFLQEVAPMPEDAKQIRPK